MCTTVRLDDTLFARGKEHAARERRTPASLIEEGLTVVLERPGHERRKRIVLPVSKAGGGVRPGVDLNSNVALLDLLGVR